MGMVVRTNSNAMNAYRQLGMNNNNVQKSLQKLSSGFRINSAADDAAGLAISEKMKAQIKGLEQASSNSQDGISLVQTAEGATTEIHSMLNRMVELADKSANGTIQDDVDREAIQSEVDALNTEISRIAKSTNFNGINLIDGNLKGEVAPDVKNIELSDIAATKASFVTGTVAAGTTALAKGDTITVDFAWIDDAGKDQINSVKFTANSAKEFQSEDGTKYTVVGTAATANELLDAVQSELSKNDSVKENFKITPDTDDTKKLTFESNTAGTKGARVVSMNLNATVEKSTAAPSMVAGKNTKAEDAKQQLDLSGLKAFGQDKGDGEYTNETNLKEAIEKASFEIGGNKFILVGKDADAESVKQIGSEYTVINSASDPGDEYTKTDDASVMKSVNRVCDMDLTEKDTTSHDILYDDVSTKKLSATAVSGNGLKLQIGDTADDFNNVTVSVDDLSAEGLGTTKVDVTTQDKARTSIQTIKDAINQVSTNRSNLGAMQNRLEHTINNLNTTHENITAANSRIRDTDMAKEMMDYTKMNVLTQAAQAMLAQANQAPQAVLQLLQ